MVSPSYKTFKIVGLDASFLLPILRTPKLMWSYKLASTQGASVVRRNLDIDYFNEITLDAPINIEEQRKIGTFFATLDNLIAVNQRKLPTKTRNKKIRT